SSIPTVGTFSHPPSPTVPSLLLNAPLPSLPSYPSSCHAKNLLLRDKKHGLYLVTARHDADTNARKIALDLNLKANFRLADEKYLRGHLKVERGSLGPLALANDGSAGVEPGEGGPQPTATVKFVMDEKLKGVDVVYSHPGRCDWSTGIRTKDLVRFVEGTGREVIWVDFPAKVEGGGGGGGEG
ncbi:hypothetical protein ScalyP_jg3942, partial [Parmales sp. scaly parma]